jgi:hypothetical protein
LNRISYKQAYLTLMSPKEKSNVLDEIVTDMGGIKGSEKGVNTKINIHTVHEEGERFQLRIKVWYVANNPGVGNNQRQLVRGV